MNRQFPEKIIVANKRAVNLQETQASEVKDSNIKEKQAYKSQSICLTIKLLLSFLLSQEKSETTENHIKMSSPFKYNSYQIVWGCRAFTFWY